MKKSFHFSKIQEGSIGVNADSDDKGFRRGEACLAPTPEKKGAAGLNGRAAVTLADFYNHLGQLAECPQESHAALLENCRKGLMELCPEGSTSLILFQKAMESLSRDQREEAYLRAFDITPLAIPYVSIHLFGEESYKRGEFMAKFLEAHEQHGFDCGSELPDHIAVMLRFASRLNLEERREMLDLCLKEPVRKMTFALKKADHPYQFLLQAFLDVIETDLKTEVCHA